MLETVSSALIEAINDNIGFNIGYRSEKFILLNGTGAVLNLSPAAYGRTP